MLPTRVMDIHTCSTHSFSDTLTVWFPSSDTTQAGVVGVASINARTASAPMRQPYTFNTASLRNCDNLNFTVNLLHV